MSAWWNRFYDNGSAFNAQYTRLSTGGSGTRVSQNRYLRIALIVILCLLLALLGYVVYTKELWKAAMDIAKLAVPSEPVPEIPLDKEDPGKGGPENEDPKIQVGDKIIVIGRVSNVSTDWVGENLAE
jgi:hypothetical protein